ncbi:MAG: alanine racemase [Helicobacter sp.]|uniref:alanine racemase n=1 Tax=Helicobacter sp. TaxID=218 RepID=UPI002A9159CD|nr:alanine racemase [Helicobacter sp.]MDY5822888.1 alanine racemase [Helicobacter sp.]
MAHKDLKRYVYANIHTDHFLHNLKLIREYVPQRTHLMLVLKADAYGHGALKLGKLALTHGIYQLGVATFDEAMELREHLTQAKILVLGYTPPSVVDEAIKHDIELCVYDIDMARELNKSAKRQNKQAKIHIKLDTGMNRIGYQCDSKSLNEIHEIAKLSNVFIRGIFTHFASADCDLGYLNLQYERFCAFVSLLPKHEDTLLHCANSASIMNASKTHLDMVRLGIIAYGLKPSFAVDMQGLELKPVMSFRAHIVHIKEVDANECVSYGGTFITHKKTKIATLPVGYADGYMRLLSNKAEVLIRGKRARVIGNICMDQCMVDVSDIEEVKVGDCAVLFGYDDFGNILSVDELAAHIGTINYELICAVSKRVARVYV